eukprot:1119595-Pyramimonas_sp.AAC.2
MEVRLKRGRGERDRRSTDGTKMGGGTIVEHASRSGSRPVRIASGKHGGNAGGLEGDRQRR